MDVNKIKLIIWDLDETFWEGTLSEGEVRMKDICLQIVKISTAKGIVNAICSRNEEKDVASVLNDAQIADFFVFNSIDWTPKGKRIKSMLSNMGLRSANTLFLDDNQNNIGEALFAADNQSKSHLPEYVCISSIPISMAILDSRYDCHRHPCTCQVFCASNPTH